MSVHHATSAPRNRSNVGFSHAAWLRSRSWRSATTNLARSSLVRTASTSTESIAEACHRATRIGSYVRGSKFACHLIDRSAGDARERHSPGVVVRDVIGRHPVLGGECRESLVGEQPIELREA